MLDDTYKKVYTNKRQTCTSKDEIWDQTLKRCVKIAQSVLPTKRCPNGYHKNKKGDCIKTIVQNVGNYEKIALPGLVPANIEEEPEMIEEMPAMIEKPLINPTGNIPFAPGLPRMNALNVAVKPTGYIPAPPGFPPPGFPPPRFPPPPGMNGLNVAVNPTGYIPAPPGLPNFPPPFISQQNVPQKDRQMTESQIIEYQLKRNSSWNNDTKYELSAEQYKKILDIVSDRQKIKSLPIISETQLNSFLAQNNITVAEQVIEYTRLCLDIKERLIEVLVNEKEDNDKWDKKEKFFLTNMEKVDKTKYDEFITGMYKHYGPESGENYNLFTLAQRKDYKEAVRDCIGKFLFLPSIKVQQRKKDDITKNYCVKFLKLKFKSAGALDDEIVFKKLENGEPFEVSKKIYNDLLAELSGTYDEKSIKISFDEIGMTKPYEAPKKVGRLVVNPDFNLNLRQGGKSRRKKHRSSRKIRRNSLRRKTARSKRKTSRRT